MNKKRNLLLTILVIIAVFVINHFTGDIFDGLSNSYLADFLLKIKCAALAVLGALIVRKLWIYQRFDPALLKKGWAAGIPELLVVLMSIFNLLTSKRPITARPIDIVFLVLEMICVGIHEETLFRGMLQNAFHELFGEDSVGHVMLAAVSAGVCFGLIHLTNALQPDISLSDAAIQAISACGSGIFYGAVYFRTGKNLWYNVLIHGLHDIFVFLVQGALSGAGSSAVITSASQGTNAMQLVLQALGFAAIGLFLLRKKKVEPLLKQA